MGKLMELEFKKAESREYASTLTQKNMKAYYKKRNILWNPVIFNESWEAFENLEIHHGSKRIGLLRFSFSKTNCYIRDLQIESIHQGHGFGSDSLNYAIHLAKALNNHFIKLRVFSENPAIRMYRRHGFTTRSKSNDLVEMSLDLRS